MKTESLLSNDAAEIQQSLLTNTLPKSFKQLLSTFGGYYNGQMYRFSLDAEQKLTLQLVKQNDFSALIVIVARQFYHEQAKTYPIENKTELKKLLALEFSDNENTYYHLWGYKEGTSQVNIWQYNLQVPSALLKLPETLLLALTAKENQVIEINNSEHKKQSLFVGRSGDLIYSIIKNSVINSSQLFAMSIGIGKTPQDRIVAVNDNAEQLASGIKQLSLPIISAFIQKPKVESRLQLLKNIALPFFIVLGLYFSASSVFLTYKQQNLQQSLASQSSEVSVALERQQAFDQQLTRYSQLQTFLSSQQASSPLWFVMADLFPQAKFTNIRIAANRFVIRGSTEKATDLLELLSNMPQVIDAKFDFPTRNSRNQEVFVISFNLLPLQDESEAIKLANGLMSNKANSKTNNVIQNKERNNG